MRSSKRLHCALLAETRLPAAVLGAPRYRASSARAGGALGKADECLGQSLSDDESILQRMPPREWPQR
jgi:hypothetical protein